eukprot:gene24189-9786_t
MATVNQKQVNRLPETGQPETVNQKPEMVTVTQKPVIRQPSARNWSNIKRQPETRNGDRHQETSTRSTVNQKLVNQKPVNLKPETGQPSPRNWYTVNRQPETGQPSTRNGDWFIYWQFKLSPHASIIPKGNAKDPHPTIVPKGNGNVSAFAYNPFSPPPTPHPTSPVSRSHTPPSPPGATPLSQHAFINPKGDADAFNCTYNCLACSDNTRTYNDGYHILHHLNSRLHWSELPSSFLSTLQRHQERDGSEFPPLTFPSPYTLFIHSVGVALGQGSQFPFCNCDSYLFSSPYRVSPIVEFMGDGMYCFTLLADGFVPNPNQFCANADLNKFEIKTFASCRPTKVKGYLNGVETSLPQFSQSEYSPDLIMNLGVTNLKLNKTSIGDGARMCIHLIQGACTTMEELAAPDARFPGVLVTTAMVDSKIKNSGGLTYGECKQFGIEASRFLSPAGFPPLNFTYQFRNATYCEVQAQTFSKPQAEEYEALFNNPSVTAILIQDYDLVCNNAPGATYYLDNMNSANSCEGSGTVFPLAMGYLPFTLSDQVTADYRRNEYSVQVLYKQPFVAAADSLILKKFEFYARQNMRNLLLEILIDGVVKPPTWGPVGSDTLRVTQLLWDVPYVKDNTPTITFRLKPGSDFNKFFFGNGKMMYSTFDTTEEYCPTLEIPLSA